MVVKLYLKYSISVFLVYMYMYMKNHVLSKLTERKQHTAQHMYSHTKNNNNVAQWLRKCNSCNVQYMYL